MLVKNIIARPHPEVLGVIYGRLQNEDPISRKSSPSPVVENPSPLLPSTRIVLHQRDLRRVEQAIAYIEKNYAGHISPEGLSLEVDISVSKLQAGLRHMTGYSLYAYQEQVRIRRAKTILEDTNKPLRVVAGAVGFKTHSHFGEVFKKITGSTPSEYRNKYGR
jgi:two-component system, response regulator YesN